MFIMSNKYPSDDMISNLYLLDHHNRPKVIIIAQTITPRIMGETLAYCNTPPDNHLGGVQLWNPCVNSFSCPPAKNLLRPVPGSPVGTTAGLQYRAREQAFVQVPADHQLSRKPEANHLCSLNLSLLTALRGTAAKALRGDTTGLGWVFRTKAGEACPQGCSAAPSSPCCRAGT